MMWFKRRQLPAPPLVVSVIYIAGTIVAPIHSSQVYAEGFALEEVVVTARKRAESIQDVPVAVSAFSGDSLKSLGISNIKDMDGIVPGLNMGGGGNGTKGDSNPFIRGIGQRETKVTIDSAVGTYLDGIYVGRAAGALLDAVDVESIQVLRGPQGTLFGKNTTGGAIVVQTAKPEPELGGKVDLTVGTLGRRNGSMTVNVPLIDELLYSRFTLASTKTDGYVKNKVDNVKWSDDDRLMGIAQFRWQPSDELVTDLLLSNTRTRQKSRGQKCRFFGPELEKLGFSTTQLESLYDISASISAQEQCRRSGADLDAQSFNSELNNSGLLRQSIYEVDTNMAALNIAWDMGPLIGFDTIELKSISGFRRTEQKADEDLDGSSAALIGRIQPRANETDQYSQEFQFNGSALDGRLNATFGVYAFLEQTDNDWLQDYAAFAPTTTSENAILLAQSELTERETDNQAWAAFSQVSFDVTELIEITLGLRYTEEERETRYQEASVYLPSIGNGTFCPAADCLNLLQTSNTLHPFSEPGARPFHLWQYGYDSNISYDDEGNLVIGNGNLEDREIGQFGRDQKSRKDSALTPSLSVKFLASDDTLDAFSLDSALLFFTYSQGFRSGGVVVANRDFPEDGLNGIKDLSEFEPEHVDNYEFGLKLDAFDKRLRTNLAAYYTDYTDIQVTTIVSSDIGIPLPAIENAGKAVIHGVEGEFTYVPIEVLRFTASFAYTHADYKEYIVEVREASGEFVTIDRADEPMPRVADWTGFFAMDYFIFTESMGTFIPSISLRYTSELYHGFDRGSFLVRDELTSDAITFYDARLTWQLPGDRMTVTLWGKNLTDENEYLTGGIPLVGVARSTSLIYAEPQSFGLDFSYAFGE